MLTVKDFKCVGLTYVNQNLKFDPTYDYSEVTYSDGGFRLTRLKNFWRRIWLDFGGVNVDYFINKHYKNRVLKLTCSQEKLADLTPNEMIMLKGQIISALNDWKIWVRDVKIYAMEEDN